MEQVKLTWKDLIKDFFGVNDFDEDLTKELKDSHLYDTMNKIDDMAKTFNTPVHCEENKSSKNGGLSKAKVKTKGIDPKTLEAMTKIHREIKEGREGRE